MKRKRALINGLTENPGGCDPGDVSESRWASEGKAKLVYELAVICKRNA